MNYCPNCGSNVNNNDFYCQKCGTKLKNKKEENHQNNQEIKTQEPKITNDNFIDAYIGSSSEKIRKGGFSLITFFLGVPYLFYRKMFLLGGVFLLVYILSILIIPSTSFFVLFFGLLFISYKFNRFYLTFVREEIYKLKDKYYKKSNEELLEICKKEGKPNMLPVVIVSIIYFILLTFYSVPQLVSRIQKSLNTEATNVIGSLYINVPDILKLNDYNNTSYKRYLTNSEDYYCSLNVIKSDSKLYNNDALIYLQKAISSSEIFVREINDITWYYVIMGNEYNKKYYYSSVYNNNIYYIEYVITKDKDSVCNKAIDEIINSLRME